MWGQMIFLISANLANCVLRPFGILECHASCLHQSQFHLVTWANQVRAMLEAGHDSRGAARQGPRSIMFWALLLSFLVGTHAARKSGGGKSSRDVSFGTVSTAGTMHSASLKTRPSLK